METVRAPFYAGLIGLAAGVVILGIWWVIGEPASANGKFLIGLFFGLGLLLTIIGGFLAFCIGSVYLLNLIVDARAKSK